MREEATIWAEACRREEGKASFFLGKEIFQKVGHMLSMSEKQQQKKAKWLNYNKQNFKKTRAGIWVEQESDHIEESNYWKELE